MSRVSEHNASVATVGDLWPDFVARATALCRTVAGRDLTGLPLYILLQSEVAEVMGRENYSDGYTTPNLDLNLRSVIGDRWHGRGPCMVLNDVPIADEHFPEDVDIVAMSIVFHELAHILDRPMPVDLQSLPSDDRIEFETMVIANAAPKPDAVPAALTDSAANWNSPWDNPDTAKTNELASDALVCPINTPSR